jgi:chemotaxis protein MotB
MKRIVIYGILLVAAGFQSCVVVSTRKYNALLATQDSLSAGWNTANVKITSLEEELASLRADTATYRSKIRQMGADLSSMNTNLSDLKSSSSGEIAKLAADLKKREARLKEVEDILRKRDEATNALRDKLQKALLGFRQSGLSVDIRNGKVYVSLTDKLLFATGSIVIDDKGKQALKELATVLKTQPEINISVEGHTDNQKITNLGQIKDNWDLSVLRATSVVRYLTDEQRIDNARITATGKGQYQPVDLGSTPEAMSHNRRIEIVLSPKLDELYQLIK